MNGAWARTGQVVAIAILWAGVLIGYDRLFNRHLLSAPAPALVATNGPELGIWVNNAGCNGSRNQFLLAIQDVPWLANVELVPRPGPPFDLSCGLGATGQVTDLAAVDFMQLEAHLRDIGIVPIHVELGGVPHFAVVASVSDQIACSLCAQAAGRALTPLPNGNGGSTFAWLDSVRADLTGRTVTAYTRLGATADVQEMINALDDAGFPPSAVHVLTGDQA